MVFVHDSLPDTTDPADATLISVGEPSL